MVLNTLMADPLMTIFGHCYLIYIYMIYSSSTRIQQVMLDLQKSLMITALVTHQFPSVAMRLKAYGYTKSRKI